MTESQLMTSETQQPHTEVSQHLEYQVGGYTPPIDRYGALPMLDQSEVTDTEASDEAYDFYTPIPDTEIEENKRRDEHVSDDLTASLSGVEAVRKRLGVIYATTRQKADTEINTAEELRVQRHADIEALKNLAIKQIERDSQLAANLLDFETDSFVFKRTEIKDGAESLFQHSDLTMIELSQEIDRATAALAKHEASQNDAINTINSLIIRREQLLGDLANAENDRRELRENIMDCEGLDLDLANQRNALHIKERKEREIITQPKIDAYKDTLIDDPEARRQILANIWNTATSDTLTEILGEIESCKEAQAANKNDIKRKARLLESFDAHLAELEEELSEIPSQIEKARNIVTHQRHTVALWLEEAGADITARVKNLDGIIKGDTSPVAGIVVHESLQGLLETMRTFQSIVSSGSYDFLTEEGYQQPTFTIPESVELTAQAKIIQALLDERDAEGEKITAAIETVDTVKRISIVGIARGIWDKGTRLSYESAHDNVS